MILKWFCKSFKFQKLIHPFGLEPIPPYKMLDTNISCQNYHYNKIFFCKIMNIHPLFEFIFFDINYIKYFFLLLYFRISFYVLFIVFLPYFWIDNNINYSLITLSLFIIYLFIHSFIKLPCLFILDSFWSSSKQ